MTITDVNLNPESDFEFFHVEKVTEGHWFYSNALTYLK
jgi:hypothetical protein